jgi:hypothetical protein
MPLKIMEIQNSKPNSDSYFNSLNNQMSSTLQNTGELEEEYKKLSD